MNEYKVTIHYEGAWTFEVLADNEDEAREFAEAAFDEADLYEITSDMQSNVDDVEIVGDTED